MFCMEVIEMRQEDIKEKVREGYARRARGGSRCGGENLAQVISQKVRYTDEELVVVPEEANLGLDCGNPVAVASLRKGETVLDLGSGAGFDCFLAGNKPYSCINFADKVKKSPVFQHLRIATGSWLDFTSGEFQRQPQRADYVLQFRRQTVRRRDPAPQ